MRQKISCALLLMFIVVGGIFSYQLFGQAPWSLRLFHGFFIAFAAFAILYSYQAFPSCRLTDAIFSFGGLLVCLCFGLALYQSLRNASAFNLLLPFVSMGSVSLLLLVVRQILHPERVSIQAV